LFWPPGKWDRTLNWTSLAGGGRGEGGRGWGSRLRSSPCESYPWRAGEMTKGIGHSSGAVAMKMKMTLRWRTVIEMGAKYGREEVLWPFGPLVLSVESLSPPVEWTQTTRCHIIGMAVSLRDFVPRFLFVSLFVSFEPALIKGLRVNVSPADAWCGYII